MRTTLALVMSLCLPLAAEAAGPRTFTDHDGNTIRAELVGVKDGEVLLKKDAVRRTVALSSFVLDDREFIVETLRKQKQTKPIQDLMDYSVREIAGAGGRSVNLFDEPGSGSRRPSGGASGSGSQPASKSGAASTDGKAQATFGHSRSNSASKKLDGDPDRPMTMYGLSLPTAGLLDVPADREWTDLLGQTMSGRFERVLSPGIVLLNARVAGTNERATQRVALAVLSRADIEHIAEALSAERDRVIFPDEPYVAPDAEAKAKGVRTFTDRLGVKLAAKFVRTVERNVVLDVAGTEKTFPLSGLSKEDRDWIEGRTRQRQAWVVTPGSGSPEPPAPAKGPKLEDVFGGAPGDAQARVANPWSGSGPTQYSFQCKDCGRNWTDGQPNSDCPHCRKGYHFVCKVCGHEWNHPTDSLDICPKCNPTFGGAGYGGAAVVRDMDHLMERVGLVMLIAIALLLAYFKFRR